MILKRYHRDEPVINITLRGIPDAVHERLREEAERNHRSLNGEILARLEASLRPGSVSPSELLDRVRQRRSRLELPELDCHLLTELKSEGRS